MTRRIEILTCTHCGVHGPHLEDNGSKLLECRNCLRLMNYETGEVLTPGDPNKTRAIIEEEMRREKEERVSGMMDVWIPKAYLNAEGEVWVMMVRRSDGHEMPPEDEGYVTVNDLKTD